MACGQKVANLAVARIIPLFLGGLIIYGCWAFTKPLCIDYLLDTPHEENARQPRRGLAAGLLVVLYVLLVFLLAAYLRLIVTIVWNPGYIPRGPEWRQVRENNLSDETKQHSGKHRRKSRSRQRDGTCGRDVEVGLGSHTEKSAYRQDAVGLEAYYLKDVFVCREDGKPTWCSTCCQFKSDRAHHCREVDRCVRKMDHFCPWVGGVVSETSFKFFIQFIFYTTLFTGFNIIVMAVFVAELSKERGSVNVHWILVLALSAFFGLFAFAMLLSSLHITWHNSSTIENLDRHTKVWMLAILIPRLEDLPRPASFPIVSFPPLSTTQSSIPRRHFAILHTKPGESPFDLGSPLANLKEVLGYSIVDWLLPLKHSPCTDHSHQEGAFRVGPVVERLRREAGLVPSRSSGGSNAQSHHRRKRTHGHQNDEGNQGNPNQHLARRSSERHHREHRDHRQPTSR
ncbi:hypothetical protein AJ80_00602 [Polytolypa hystricis UAMH7299]|uniref:Palmitoyltransferase n=1 Tax=Polytolypa hystricis (strain UAMH7299) TaxID=1447883 RepID=A0A2B7YUR3_POLH7|nr:hypothetical protein AJ80_00602 [Polytolypa hystricis UAMH7299]